MSDWHATLQEGARQLALDLTAQQFAQLQQYVVLLQKWNKVYNLTAVRNVDDIVHLHLLDCLAVVAPFRHMLAGQGQSIATDDGLKVLDVGAGGGLPGVVLAICCPDVQVHCVDAVAKKMAFVRQAGSEIRLPNLQAIHARVETLTQRYGVITSRAFASLADFVSLTEPLLMEGGLWMAMKGKTPQDEITALATTVDVFHVEPLRVPGLEAERCIVWMRKPAIISGQSAG